MSRHAIRYSGGTEPSEPRVFQWPCDRRDAHHEHLTHCPGGEARCLSEHQDLHPCPGVPAHPATQIGGNYASERPEAPRY